MPLPPPPPPPPRASPFDPFAACGASPPAHVAPSFYMYDGPTFFWGERLAACYTRKNGRPPWSVTRGAPLSSRRRNATAGARRRGRRPLQYGIWRLRIGGVARGRGVGGNGEAAAALSLLAGGGSSRVGPSSSSSSSSSAPTTAEAGPAPHADLSHSLWLHAALRNHRRRVLEPEGAGLACGARVRLALRGDGQLRGHQPRRSHEGRRRRARRVQGLC